MSFTLNVRITIYNSRLLIIDVYICEGMKIRGTNRVHLFQEVYWKSQNGAMVGDGRHTVLNSKFSFNWTHKPQIIKSKKKKTRC